MTHRNRLTFWVTKLAFKLADATQYLADWAQALAQRAWDADMGVVDPEPMREQYRWVQREREEAGL